MEDVGTSFMTAPVSQPWDFLIATKWNSSKGRLFAGWFLLLEAGVFITLASITLMGDEDSEMGEDG